MKVCNGWVTANEKAWMHSVFLSVGKGALTDQWPWILTLQALNTFPAQTSGNAQELSGAAGNAVNEQQTQFTSWNSFNIHVHHKMGKENEKSGGL